MEEINISHFRSGTVLVFSGSPSGLEFGVDGLMWTTGPKFIGLKMVPDGLHCINYRVASKDQPDASHLCSIFLYLDSGSAAGLPRVKLWRWDKDTEQFVSAPTDKVPSGDRIYDLEKYLAPFPRESDAISNFKLLSSHIDRELLSSVLPVDGHGITTATSSYHAHKEFEKLIDPFNRDKNQMIRFTEIDFLRGPRGVMLESEENYTPIELSSRMLDMSEYVCSLFGDFSTLEKSEKFSQRIIGELQFSFILLLYCQNFEGFEQWRALLRLLCTSSSLVATCPFLYASLLCALYSMIDSCPVDIVNTEQPHKSSNLLFEWLHDLISTCRDNNICIEKANRLESLLLARFPLYSLTRDMVDDDDSPVVVVISD